MKNLEKLKKEAGAVHGALYEAEGAVLERLKMMTSVLSDLAIVDQNLKESSVGDALFFHAKYVTAAWHAKRVASIGNHIFYR